MTTGARSGVEGDDSNYPTSPSEAVAASMLGLDPIKVEQRYLALYSLYATHMGQGNEAAQVATKHAISDLWKEASAWDAILLPSPVALTITVKTIDHDAATLQSSARRLSRVARKSILV